MPSEMCYKRLVGLKSEIVNQVIFHLIVATNHHIYDINKDSQFVVYPNIYS